VLAQVLRQSVGQRIKAVRRVRLQVLVVVLRPVVVQPPLRDVRAPGVLLLRVPLVASTRAERHLNEPGLPCDQDRDERHGTSSD
jgi:hypothetical protein